MLDQDLGQLRRGALDRFRANHLGIIFQQFNLVPYLSALANVTLPCRLSPSAGLGLSRPLNRLPGPC